MREFILTHKWIIIIGGFVMFLSPVAINYILLIPSNAHIVGKDTDWLSFWGGYLGAVISSAIAFFILYVQRKDNHRENEESRKLQRNILLYQQQCMWLSDLRRVMAEHVDIYQENGLKEIINLLKYGNIDFVLPKIKQIYDNLSRTDSMIGMLLVENSLGCKIDNYKNDFSKNYNILSLMISDLQFLAMMYCNKVPVLNTLADANFQERASKELKNLLQQHNNIIILDYNHVYSIANSIIQPLPGLYSEMRDMAFIYIQKERTRIDLILQHDGTR